MKKIKISALFLFLICVGISSCGKDEADEPTANSKIAGKWYVKTAVVTTYNGSTIVGTNTTSAYTAADYMEFSVDGKYTYPIEGQTAPQVGSYTINDELTRLTLNETDDTEYYNIQSLTSSELVISQEDSYTEAGVTFKIIEVITHSKTPS